jgi:hypothetical protein
VSSITDGGVGTYTVNFTTAMADANYAFTSTSVGGTYSSGSATGVSTIGILVRRGDNDAAFDAADVYVAVFR